MVSLRGLWECDTPLLTSDPGSSAVRAGWSFESKPRFSIPPIMAKYRDRKLGKTFSFAGSDCYADTTARGHIRGAFEAGTGIVSNWDVMEHVLDYIFLKLGMNDANGKIEVPIVMTEAVANLPYSRKCTCKLSIFTYIMLMNHHSNDRNHLRVLRRAFAGIRHRLPLFLPT